MSRKQGFLRVDSYESVLDGNDPSDFKADITEFLLRFSGYEDLENVSFFIYSRREGKVYTRRTGGLRQDLRRYIKLEILAFVHPRRE